MPDIKKDFKLKVVEINNNDILPNRFQPRKYFDEEEILQLSESIKEHGVLSPVIVRRLGDKYELVAGERRYKANILAGNDSIPAIIMDVNDKESSEIAVVENIQRKDLNPVEEAISYKRTLDIGYMTQEQLAQKMGKSQSYIANKIRLLKLSDEVQDALMKKQISERHARSLLKLESQKQQNEMLNRIITERLTVRKTDEEINNMNNNMNNNLNNNLSTMNDNPNVVQNIFPPNNNNIEDNNQSINQGIFENNLTASSFSSNANENKSQSSYTNLVTEDVPTENNYRELDLNSPIRQTDNEFNFNIPSISDLDNNNENTVDSNNSLLQNEVVAPVMPDMTIPDVDISQVPQIDNFKNSNLEIENIQNQTSQDMPTPIASTYNIPENNNVQNIAPIIDKLDDDNDGGNVQSQINVQNNPTELLNESTPNNNVMSNHIFNNSFMPQSQNNNISDNMKALNSEINSNDNSIFTSSPIIDTTINNNNSQSETKDTNDNENYSITDSTDNSPIQLNNSIPEPAPEPIIVNDYNQQYDPIMPAASSTPTIDFKSIINLVRKCASAIENSGYKIETEEYDLENMYQVVFRIEKK